MTQAQIGRADDKSDTTLMVDLNQTEFEAMRRADFGAIWAHRIKLPVGQRRVAETKCKKVAMSQYIKDWLRRAKIAAVVAGRELDSELQNDRGEALRKAREYLADPADSIWGKRISNIARPNHETHRKSDRNAQSRNAHDSRNRIERAEIGSYFLD